MVRTMGHVCERARGKKGLRGLRRAFLTCTRVALAFLLIVGGGALVAPAAPVLAEEGDDSSELAQAPEVTEPQGETSDEGAPEQDGTEAPQPTEVPQPIEAPQQPADLLLPENPLIQTEQEPAPRALAPSDDPLPTPATTATATTTFIDADGNPFTARPTFMVGDEISIQTTITANGAAWGFTYGLSFFNDSVSFDPTKWEQDNPGIPVPAVYTYGDPGDGEGFTSYRQSTVRVIAESNGKDLFLSEDNPTKVLTFRFIATHRVTAQFGGASISTRQRVTLFTDPSLRLNDLRLPGTGLFYLGLNGYPAAEVIPEALRARTVAAALQGSAYLYATVTSPATFALDLVDGDPPVRLRGDTIVFTATFGTNKDAYGYAAILSVSPKYLYELDLDSWATDNPGIPAPTLVLTGGNSPYLLLVCESDGKTVVIPADTSLELTVRLKVVHEESNALIVVSVIRSALITDPTLRTWGEEGLMQGSSVSDWTSALDRAEGQFRLDITDATARLQIRIGCGVAIKFSEETGFVGANPRPVTVTATITAPPNESVYGMTAGIIYEGAYLTFDRQATTAANEENGLTLGYGETLNAAATSGTITQLYLESNGTPLIAPGEAREIKLVFNTNVQRAGTRSVTSSERANNLRPVLFVDPSVRAKEVGEGLTTIDFNYDAIQEAEDSGKVRIAAVTAGSVTTAKLLDDLVLDTSGYYTISSTELLQKFADAVNAQGENMIKGNITADLVLPEDFVGIGTAQYPFCGEIKGSTTTRAITVNRIVTSGNDPAVGGLVNYLGENGAITSLVVKGNITVSGTVGNATIGGVVGSSNGGRIDRVTSGVNIDASGIDGSVGGIAGSATKAQFTAATYPYVFYSCKNTGTVSGGANTGGIVGSFNGEVSDTTTDNTVYLCTNTGAISGTNAGGIAGNATGGVIVQSGNGISNNDRVNPAYAGGGTINAIGANSASGGVVGIIGSASIINCYNTGAINGGANAGGVVGRVAGAATLSECYSNAQGSVTGLVDGANVGGIVGSINAPDAKLTANFNLGALSATGVPAAGGVVGKAALIPARYNGNVYLVGTATGDALDMAAFAPGSAKATSAPAEHLTFSGASSAAPGKYAYIFGAPVFDEPAKDGQGTYLLGGVNDLMWFALKVNTNTAPDTFNQLSVRLTADVDLSDTGFPGIGGTVAAQRYGGSFDGSGHTVTLDMSGENYVGFFTYCDGATIKNLNIAGHVTGTGNMAGLAAYALNTRIENCHNKAAIIPTTTGTATHTIGGLVGSASSCTFIGCTNSGSVSLPAVPGSNRAGGIVGYLSVSANTAGSLLENCSNSGTITGGNSAGGLVGETYSLTGVPIAITGCSNSGQVTTPSGTSLGGIVAYASSGPATNVPDSAGVLRIEKCVNEGDVIGYASYLGGMLGAAGGNYSVKLMVIDCRNAGDIKSLLSVPGATNSISVGGIVGKTDGTFSPDWGNKATNEVITGNTNTGNVSSVAGGNVSSIIGMGEVQPGIVVEGNNSTVLVGNDRYNPGITYIPPTPGGDPNPGPGGDPDPGPGPGGDPNPNPGPGGNPTPGPTPGSSDSSNPGTTSPASTVSLVTVQDNQTESQPVDNRVVEAEPPSAAQPQQPVPEPEPPLADTTTATEVTLTPIPLGLGFQTMANTVLTIIVGFVALGVFALGGFAFWRMYRRRIDVK